MCSRATRLSGSDLGWMLCVPWHEVQVGAAALYTPLPSTSRPWMLSWYLAWMLPPGRWACSTILSLPWQAPQVVSMLAKAVFDAGLLERRMSCEPWQSVQEAAADLPSFSALPCAVEVNFLTASSWQPAQAAIAALNFATQSVGFAVFAPADAADYQLVVRAFCPADNIPEDPVTGSANAAIAAYLHQCGALAAIGNPYTASQGRELGRDGFVQVRVDDEGEVWIGGKTQTVVSGSLGWG